MRAQELLVSSALRRTALLAAAAAYLAAAALPAHAADWLVCRDGPQRSNYTSEAFTPPFSLVWKFTTAASDKRVPPVVTADRVFAAAGASMYALDLATGAEVWKYDAKATILAGPTYADGRVYFGANSGKIIALDAATGKEAWTVETAREIYASPVVVGGVVYAASLDRQAMALDAATGALRWSVHLTDELWGAPAVSAGLVYLPTADGQVFGLDTHDGRTRLQVTLPRRQALLNPAVVSDDAIYVAGRTVVLALSLRGMQRWAMTLDGFVAGAPALAGGRLYLGLTDGRVIAIDAVRGVKVWTFDFHARMSKEPTVVGNVVIAGSAGGTVYALDAATGALRWGYPAGPRGLAAGVSASLDLVAPPVYSNGSLYLVWNDGTLARFDARWPDPAPPTVAMLTPAENRVTGTTLPKVIGAQVFDAESGIDVASMEMTLDEVKVPTEYDPRTGYLTSTIAADSSFATGWHTITVTARDQRGNSTSKAWRFVAVPGGEEMEGAPAPTEAYPPGAAPTAPAPAAAPYPPSFGVPTAPSEQPTTPAPGGVIEQPEQP